MILEQFLVTQDSKLIIQHFFKRYFPKFVRLSTEYNNHQMNKKIQSALISVYYKDNLDKIVKILHQHNVSIYSTGGTQKFIEDLGIPVTAVDAVTGFPEILGGRVKTLQPQIFGGILFRRDNVKDNEQVALHQIPAIDLVIVDLYPFEQTVASDASEQDSIEKKVIGGISLIGLLPKISMMW